MNSKAVNTFKKRLTLCILLCCIHLIVWSQKAGDAKSPISLVIHYVGKDSGFATASLGLQTGFAGVTEAVTYIDKIPQTLASKGYPVASVDSLWQQGDSFHIQLYTGQKYNWIQLLTYNIDKQALDAAGFVQKNYSNKPLNIPQLQSLQ
ncbi:MAG TPA: hypothetical protein VLR49_10940, partial [Ferruginibacter sp.]|nr:hypothetical protein [Ferruginibacter sp.]